MMRDERQEIKCLLEFSDDKGRITDNLTEEYKRGIQDAINRLDFLWLCEKMGAYNEQDYLVMDTYRYAIIALELLIEPYFDILNSCDPEIFPSVEWYEMLDKGWYKPYYGDAFWGTATHYNYDNSGFGKQPCNATHVHWFSK